MNFDIEAIFDRMKIATNSKNDTQLCKYMGKSSSTVSGWKNGAVPPWNGLWELHHKTGVSIDWLLTGKTNNDKPESENAVLGDFDNFKKGYLKSLMFGHEAGWYARTERTTDDNFQNMAEIAFKHYKGVDIKEIKREMKKAV